MAGNGLHISECPDCRNILRFYSEKTTFQVCPSCGTSIRRSEVSGELIVSNQFVVSRKASIIQPGTTGVFEGKQFTVTGRMRCFFEEAAFNYWTILCDGEIMWLAEGYGLYSVLRFFPNNHAYEKRELNNLDVGDKLKWETKTGFILEKKQTVQKWEIEGEVWMPFIKSTFDVLDLSASKDRHLTIFDAATNIYCFDVKNVKFSSLKLAELREANEEGKTFTCACSVQIEVKSFPYAQSCACASCGRYYVLQHASDFKPSGSCKPAAASALALGTKGQVKGIDYQVVGFAEKEEKNEYHARWREYTLYNAAEGYAFLSEYDGHWTYLREELNTPVRSNINSQEFSHSGVSFDLFNSYNYVIIAAQGEFPQNIFDNNATKAWEFIAPPYIFIEERNQHEGIIWYKGHHISQFELRTAFPQIHLPPQSGVGAVQPARMEPGLLGPAVLVALMVLVAIHTAFSFASTERIVYDQTIHFKDSSDTRTIASEKFILEKASSNLRIEVSAPISNSWFELNVSLVNTANGSEYNIEKGVEYYHGYTDGETWTEGSQSGNAFFTRVPAGSYFLEINGTREHIVPSGVSIPGMSDGSISHFTVVATYDVPTHRNIWLSVLILIIWPVILYAKNIGFESARWENSPYSNE